MEVWNLEEARGESRAIVVVKRRSLQYRSIADILRADADARCSTAPVDSLKHVLVDVFKMFNERCFDSHF